MKKFLKSAAAAAAAVIHNGNHHYVVVGINTSDDSDKNVNNSGVRNCPNITNLVRYN